MFFGGPHAAFFATKKEFIRFIPGRIIGVSKDRHNKTAYRLSLQTREQHIRRERATSNICTSQALLAVMASFYAIYHGPEGLKNIALKINHLTKKLYNLLKSFKSVEILNTSFFDTLSFKLPSQKSALKLFQAFQDKGINLYFDGEQQFSVTLNESTQEKDLLSLQEILKNLYPNQPFIEKNNSAIKEAKSLKSNLEFTPSLSPPNNSDFFNESSIPTECLRTSPYLKHPVFNSYHSETELLRYIQRLQDKDLSLSHSMIPLGSCTMKLNSSTELSPVAWPQFCNLHPFAPKEQCQGSLEIIKELETYLSEITGFKAFSFQANAGSQGEYAGLLAIKKYLESKGEGQREICLVPSSAHGTNPASAIMAGFKVIPLNCTQEGLIDEKDFTQKLNQYGDKLAALMLTYPSTYGFFEEGN